MKRVAIFFILMAAVLTATPITFSVDVNTAPLAGTSGYIDLTFNKGNSPALDGLATITGFSGAIVNGVPAIMGAISGSLPGTVAIANTGAPANDYFQAITFGSLLHLVVTSSGPAQNVPALVGSTFVLGLYADLSGKPLVTSDGVIATFDLNGTATNATVLTRHASVTVVTPEPATLAIAAFGLAMLLVQSRRR